MIQAMDNVPASMSIAVADIDQFTKSVVMAGQVFNPSVAAQPNVNMDTANWGYVGKGSIQDAYNQAMEQKSWSGYATPYDEKKGDYNWLVGGNGAYRVDESGNIIYKRDEMGEDVKRPFPSNKYYGGYDAAHPPPEYIGEVPEWSEGGISVGSKEPKAYAGGGGLNGRWWNEATSQYEQLPGFNGSSNKDLSMVQSPASGYLNQQQTVTQTQPITVQITVSGEELATKGYVETTVDVQTQNILRSLPRGT